MSTTTIPPRSINRTNCFIGKSNWVADANANSLFDDIRIFNRGLTQSEIQTVMNTYSPNSYSSIKSSLTHHWTFNQNLVDSVGTTDLYEPINVAFTTI